MKLNLGCGKNIKEGYINLDKLDSDGVDIVHDLDMFPYPFDDNTFDEIYCSHVLEHVIDLKKVMKEIYRISKPNALIKVKGPYFSSQGAFNNPEHKKFFTWETFGYFSDKYKIMDRKIFFCSVHNFMQSEKFKIVDFLINLKPLLYQRLFCWILPASEIHYLLKVEK